MQINNGRQATSKTMLITRWWNTLTLYLITLSTNLPYLSELNLYYFIQMILIHSLIIKKIDILDTDRAINWALKSAVYS